MCKKHSNQQFFDKTANCWRCKTCRVEAVRKTRRNAKAVLVKLCGGKCVKCGYNKCLNALEFHHTNPENKSFSIGKELGRKGIDALKAEAAKCFLLCANCHAEFHAAE